MTPFIVTCAARTGSTYLRYLLDSHSDIECFGEVFQKKKRVVKLPFFKNHITLSDRYKTLSKKFNSMPLPDFIDKVLYANSQSVAAIGLKIKTDELYDSKFQCIKEYFLNKKNLKIIHLRRKNILEQYISKEILKRNRIKNIKFDPTSEASFASFVVNESHLHHFVIDVIEREDKVVRDFNDRPIFSIWYEDIVNPDSDCLISMQKFLSLEPKELSSPTLKIVRDYRSLILNFDELKNWVKQSSFEKRLIL